MTAAIDSQAAALAARIEDDLRQEERNAGFAEYRRKVAIQGGPEVEPINEERAREMTYYDSLGFYGSPEEAAEISQKDRAFAFSAENGFFVHCQKETGRLADPARLTEAQKAGRELLAQSKAIAEKMTAAGFDAFRETPFELVRYYVHSGHVEFLPNYRRICFIPCVAQALRSPQLQALEFWLSRNLFARFWTFTSGPRCALGEVRQRVRWLHRRLKKLNGQEFLKTAGVRLVFRATELGTPEIGKDLNPRDGGRIERDASGALTFHVHAHVIVELTKGFIAPEEWAKLVAQVGSFWGHWWGEGGVIQKARECCKYVTKPGEMLKLSGAELIELQAQLSRLKLVQPLGSLAAEIDERAKNRQRIVKQSTPDGRVHLVVKDWNKHARRTKIEAAQEAAGKLVDKSSRGFLRVVSRGVPRFGPSGVSEPSVCVMFAGASWDEAAVRKHFLVAPLIDTTAAAWRRGVMAQAAAAALIDVHTRTPTVPASGPDPGTRPRGQPRIVPFWPSDVVVSR